MKWRFSAFFIGIAKGVRMWRCKPLCFKLLATAAFGGTNRGSCCRQMPRLVPLTATVG